MRWLLLVLICCLGLLLGGCNFQSADVENAIDTPTNEKKNYNIELGYARDTLVSTLGTPEKETDELIIYKNPSLVLGLDEKKLSFIVTNDKEFKTSKGMGIGSSKEKLIKKYRKEDLYLYISDTETWIYTYYQDGVKLAFKIKDDQVVEMSIGVSPLQSMLNYKTHGAAEQTTDEEIVSKSVYLSYSPNIDANNQKLLDKKTFLQYSDIGLVQGVPVPLGNRLSEVIRKYGSSDYNYQNKELGTEYWFKDFNCSIIASEDTKLVEKIKCPIEVNRDAVNDLSVEISTNETTGVKRLELEEFLLTFYPSEKKKFYYEYFTLQKLQAKLSLSITN